MWAAAGDGKSDSSAVRRNLGLNFEVPGRKNRPARAPLVERSRFQQLQAAAPARGMGQPGRVGPQRASKAWGGAAP